MTSFCNRVSFLPESDVDKAVEEIGQHTTLVIFPTCRICDGGFEFSEAKLFGHARGPRAKRHVQKHCQYPTPQRPSHCSIGLGYSLCLSPFLFSEFQSTAISQSIYSPSFEGSFGAPAEVPWRWASPWFGPIILTSQFSFVVYGIFCLAHSFPRRVLVRTRLGDEERTLHGSEQGRYFLSTLPCQRWENLVSTADFSYSSLFLLAFP